MFGKEKKGISRIAKQYQHLFSADFLKAEDEDAWEAWALEYYRDDSYEALKKAFEAVNPRIQYRIFCILLVPEDLQEMLLPFRIKGKVLSYNAYGSFANHVDHTRANKALLGAVAQLLLGLLDILPDLKKHFRNSDRFDNYLRVYNLHILTLMTHLDDSWNERLFAHFQLNDLWPYQGIEDSSGYNPLVHLFHSRIDEKWKVKADAKMRDIILQELRGERLPRAEHENALQCYINHICTSLWGKIPYSFPLMEEQLRFIFLHGQNSRMTSHNVLMNMHLVKFVTHYEHFSAEYIPLLASFFFKDEGEQMKAYSEDTLNAVTVIYDHLPEGDLKNRIGEIKNQGEVFISEAHARKHAAKEKSEQVMNGLK